MSGIREYRKEKLKNEVSQDKDGKNRSDYDRKLQTHKIRTYGIFVGAGMILIGIIVALIVLKIQNSYSKYVIENTIRRTDSGYAEYFCYENGFVRCSRDGVSYYSFNGTQQWNKPHEINNMSIAQCSGYFAVADIGGNDIHIYSQNGYISTVSTNLPIVKISISNQGLVVAILEDKEADYINMYNQKGEKIYTIKTTVESNGVPTDISVSPDGKKLAVAFTSVKGIELTTSVVFYNFDEVGQNENERIVGGFDSYKNQLIGEVHFLNYKDVVAVAENVISFYTVKEYPKLIKNIEVEHEINQVFYSDNAFGYVYTDTENKRDMLCVFDTGGGKLFEKVIDDGYNSFCFTPSGIMAYGDKKFILMNKKGNDIAGIEFETEISKIIPTDDNKNYLFITTDKIYKIKFK